MCREGFGGDCFARLRDVLRMCAFLRGTGGVEHRTIYEFGAFLMDMVEFLTGGGLSRVQHVARLQRGLERVRAEIPEVLDPEDMCTYVMLFAAYCIATYALDRGGGGQTDEVPTPG